jgi:hypothetical protein
MNRQAIPTGTNHDTVAPPRLRRSTPHAAAFASLAAIVLALFSGCSEAVAEDGATDEATVRASIMSIDILTLEEGKIVQVYHLEDWTSAIAQLTAAE